MVSSGHGKWQRMAGKVGRGGVCTIERSENYASLSHVLKNMVYMFMVKYREMLY